MHLLKQFEQTAIYDPTNVNQRTVYQRVGVPGGWGSFYFNQVPVTAQLSGLRGSGLGLAWAELPMWAQAGLVGIGSIAAGYFAMAKFGDSTIKPALRKVGINLSGPRLRRRRRR